MDDFLNALTLLTVLQIPTRGTTISARALAYYPLVGILIGLVLAGSAWLLHLVFPGPVVAVLAVGLWVVLTGALHLDGFADACDGLFAATTPARRLEILHDVHLGAFGAVGLILLLSAKVAATASLASLVPLFLAPVLGRWAMVYAATYPLARSDGMAFLFRAGLTRREVLAATVIAAGATLIAEWATMPIGGFGLAAFTAAALVATMLAHFARSRLGGLTGDIYGLICESVELSVLLVGAAMLGTR